MKFCRNHHKSIALMAVFFFAALLQITSFPLQAKDCQAPAQNVSIDKSQAPGLVEQESGSDYRSHSKSSIVPIVVGLLAVGAVVAILVLVVFKTSYDITGTWTLTFNVPSGNAFSRIDAFDVTFSGDKSSGSFEDVDDSLGGVYSVDGKNTNFHYTGDADWAFIGTFSDKNTMNGSVTGTAWVNNGTTPAQMLGVTWIATRISAAANRPSTPAVSQNDTATKKRK